MESAHHMFWITAPPIRVLYFRFFCWNEEVDPIFTCIACNSGTLSFAIGIHVSHIRIQYFNIQTSRHMSQVDISLSNAGIPQVDENEQSIVVCVTLSDSKLE